MRKTWFFYDVDDINAGYTEGTVFLYDLYENLGHCDNDDYDIVAIKQYESCVEVLSKVLCNREPKEWDWVEEVEKEEPKVEEPQIPVINNITINLTLDSDSFNPENFLKQLNDAFNILKKEGR